MTDQKTAEETQTQENNKNPAQSFFSIITVTGFVGGVLWSFIDYLAYILNFTTIGPNHILKIFGFNDRNFHQASHFIGIFLCGIISIILSFLYYILLKNVRSIWGGIFFGIALWTTVCYWFGPSLLHVDPIHKFGTNTFVTSLCLFILFGVFVGYSISYEQGERVRKLNGERK